MSVLIKGMDMPTDRPQLLWVYPNGKALTVQSDVDPWKELQAVPVPGHGRLINADELKTAFPCGESVRTECVRATIDHAQTIIPADEIV